MVPLNSSACFTLIAGKKATASHVPLISRNSDSKDARRAKTLKWYILNEKNKLYSGLPYWDLAFDPSYDMPQVSTNRFGVSISATETIQSSRMVLSLDPPSQSGQGVSEPNIPAIVMPSATTAKEGIKILGQAIETRGVNDGWGFGVQIADANEAWYLETLSGHQWVAIRIPDNYYFVAANGPGQIQEYLPETYTYLFSHYQNNNPIQFASQHGFAYYKNGVFNFKYAYGDLQRENNRDNNYVRIAYAQHILNPSTRPFNHSILMDNSYPMFLEPEHPIRLSDIKKIQMSHYEDYPEFDPYLWSYQHESTHPFYYPIANPRTSNAHITAVYPPLDNDDVSISNIEYIALGMPGLSVYLPIYFGLEKIPTRLTSATDKADDHTLFWQFRKIQTLAFLHDPDKGISYDFQTRQAYIASQYQQLEKTIQDNQTKLEQAYTTSHDTRLITQFTQDMVDKVSQKNEQILAHFFEELHLDSLYAFKNNSERNAWFTKTLHQQDCFYRRYHCDASLHARPSRKDKYHEDVEPG